MDVNLTGYLWGMPANLTGEITGQHGWPSFGVNLTGFTFNFSTDITVFSIAAAAFSIIFIITVKIIINYSKEICKNSNYISKKLDLYSQLYGQKLLVHHNNVSFLHSLGKTESRIDEYIVEKIAIGNKDLLQLIIL